MTPVKAGWGLELSGSVWLYFIICTALLILLTVRRRIIPIELSINMQNIEIDEDKYVIDNEATEHNGARYFTDAFLLSEA